MLRRSSNKSIFLGGMITLAILFQWQVSCSQSAQVEILLNQVGYLPNASKFAAVKGKVGRDEFYIISAKTEDTVYSGKLQAEKQSLNSTSLLRLADFSRFTTKGKYFIAIPNTPNSHSFVIDNNVFEGVSKALLKGYYYQRSDMPLDAAYAGIWARAAGHPDTSVLIHSSASTNSRPEGTVVSSSKGWYDAGDYNKYIVNSGITMGTLLSAYEDFPGYFTSQKMNIPESDDAIPDLLNEVIYNLRWMLTMQDPDDGGVYHKCTNSAFDGMVMPGATKLPRYLVQKSTAAALDFTAVMAQASRVLKRFSKPLPGLADSCNAAATRAWTWSMRHPAMMYGQRQMNLNFQPAISTGDYGDRNMRDEWLWAAVEMRINKTNPEFDSVIMATMPDSLSLASWGNVAMMGYLSLCKQSIILPTPLMKIKDRMKSTLLAMANGFVQSISTSPLRTVMGRSRFDFIWGSNAVASNQGMLLVNAYLLTGNKDYLGAALSNLDYILGRNCTGYCFITGVGSRSPMHPHHRPSEADGIAAPVPGLLVGGPNPAMQDSCRYPFKEPELAYVDSMCSYASNEIAINWNAPAVYLANAINALRDKFQK